MSALTRWNKTCDKVGLGLLALCGRLYRPHYGYCLTICPSDFKDYSTTRFASLSVFLTRKLKGTEKLRTKVTAAPIFSSKANDEVDGRAVCRHWFLSQTSHYSILLVTISRLRTICRQVVPENSRFFRLENFDKHDVKLNALETHPRERRQEEIVKNSRYEGT